MSHQVQQSQAISTGQVSGNQHAKLQKLEEALVAKKAAMDGKSHTEHVAMIDVALQNVRKELDISRKAVNSQARAGHYHKVAQEDISVEEAIESTEVVSNAQADMIHKIKSVPGKELVQGQVFASMYGREPSNVSYMKENIQGLFDLVALKG